MRYIYFYASITYKPCLKINIQKGWRKCIGLQGIHSGDFHKCRGVYFGRRMCNIGRENDYGDKCVASNTSLSSTNLLCDLG